MPFSLYVRLVEEEWNAAAPEANIRSIFGTRALPKICQTDDGSRARALLSSRQLRASNSVSLTAQAHLHLVASASGSPPARGLPVLSSSPPSRAPCVPSDLMADSGARSVGPLLLSHHCPHPCSPQIHVLFSSSRRRAIRARPCSSPLQNCKSELDVIGSLMLDFGVGRDQNLT
jgi:hypothetical protein